MAEVNKTVIINFFKIDTLEFPARTQNHTISL